MQQMNTPFAPNVRQPNSTHVKHVNHRQRQTSAQSAEMKKSVLNLMKVVNDEAEEQDIETEMGSMNSGSGSFQFTKPKSVLSDKEAHKEDWASGHSGQW